MSDNQMIAVTQNVSNAWSTHATELAQWANDRLVNRSDAWGGYYAKDGESRQTTNKGQLSLEDLAVHFSHDGQTIGLHTTGTDGMCAWGAIDIDNHDGAGSPEKNLEAALAWYKILKCREYAPILEDSNGNGGYHIWVLFSEEVAHERVYYWLQQLVADYTSRGVAKPETFPKQATPTAYGNWLRLPGHHHKREHWSRFWNGEKWVEGEEAVALLLGHTGVSPCRLPDPTTACERRSQLLEGGIKSLVFETVQDWIVRCNVPLGAPKLDADGTKRWEFAVCPWRPELHESGSAFVLQQPSGAVTAGCLHENTCPDSLCNWNSLQAMYGKLKCERAEISSQDVNVAIADTDVWTPIDPHVRPASAPYLVEKLFAAESCVIAADKKCLKTTFSAHIAAAISYGPGAKVMGRYDVLEQRRVGLWSGETIGGTLWDLQQRACASINRKVDECALDVFEGAPSLDDEASILRMLNTIRVRKIGLVILDPWSNVCGRNIAENAANTFLGSQALIKLERRVRDAGALLWLNDHMSMGAAKARENGRKARIQLHDVAYGATMKWARQWMLMVRNKDYAGDGKHDFYIEMCGGAGHSTMVDVDVDEGGADVVGLRPLRISVRGRVSAVEREQEIAREKHELDQRIRCCVSEYKARGCTPHQVHTETGIARRAVAEHFTRCGGEYLKTEAGKGFKYASRSWCN